MYTDSYTSNSGILTKLENSLSFIKTPKLVHTFHIIATEDCVESDDIHQIIRLANDYVERMREVHDTVAF